MKRRTSSFLHLCIQLISWIIWGRINYVASFSRSSSMIQYRAAKPNSTSYASGYSNYQQELFHKRGGGGKNTGIASLILETIGGLFRRVISTILPLGSSSQSFTEAFEKDFGRKHPTFVESPTLNQATNQARMAGKFLVVYLPSSSPRDDKRHRAFCRTLTDPQVIKMMKTSFILWSPPVNSPGYKTALKELRARKQPYLAVVHLTEKQPRKLTTKSLHHFKPPPNPEQAVVWLNRTLEIHGHVLEDDKVERAYILKEAKLQVEQRSEYSKALQADRQREEKERQEAKEKAEREALAKKKEKEDAERRQAKAAKLGPEAAGDNISRIAIRLDDGKKISRAFELTDNLEKIFDWLDVEGKADLEKIKLILPTRPFRKVYHYPEDKDQTLQEAGLSGSLLLLIESR